MLSRLFGVLLLTVGLGGCAEPPYTNVDNAELKALLAQGVPLRHSPAGGMAPDRRGGRQSHADLR